MERVISAAKARESDRRRVPSAMTMIAVAQVKGRASGAGRSGSQASEERPASTGLTEKRASEREEGRNEPAGEARNDER